MIIIKLITMSRSDAILFMLHALHSKLAASSRLLSFLTFVGREDTQLPHSGTLPLLQPEQHTSYVSGFTGQEDSHTLK